MISFPEYRRDFNVCFSAILCANCPSWTMFVAFCIKICVYRWNEFLWNKSVQKMMCSDYMYIEYLERKLRISVFIKKNVWVHIVSSYSVISCGRQALATKWSTMMIERPVLWWWYIQNGTIYELDFFPHWSRDVTAYFELFRVGIVTSETLLWPFVAYKCIFLRKCSGKAFILRMWPFWNAYISTMERFINKKKIHMKE